MNLVELCRTLTSIDSSLSHGTKDIVQYIHDLVTSWGMHAEMLEENYNGIENANILITPRPLSKEKALLLISRLDTPDPGDYGRWIKNGANPFSASVNGEELYGLGVADSKADFICKIVALKQIMGRTLKSACPVIVGTFGGASGAGAIRLVRRKKLLIENVLVGTPTQLSLVSKGPGFAKVEISVPFSESEKKYHFKHNISEGSVSQNKVFSRSKSEIANDEFYENPILKLIDYLKKLPMGTAIISVDGGASAETMPDFAYLELDLVEGLDDGIIQKLIHIGDSIKLLSAELKSVNDQDFSPSFSTITIGQVRTYPEEIKIFGICRLIPGEGRELHEAWLEKLREDCQRVKANFQILDYKPPYSTSTESEFFKFLTEISKEMNLNTKTKSTLNCTEANVFHRLGANVAGFGPGDLLNQEHASHEHIRIPDLERATLFYKTIIERYCQ